MDNDTTGRFRHLQPSAYTKSKVADHTVTWTSTGTVEINNIDIHTESIQELEH